MTRPATTSGSERTSCEVKFVQASRVARLPLPRRRERVGREQRQRREDGRADRVPLRDRLRRVPDGVEGVGDGARLLGELRHLGDAAGVVRDRTERVDRDDHPGDREHRGRREADPVEAEAGVRGVAPTVPADGDVRREGPRDDDEPREPGRLEPHREPRDDDRAGAGLGRVGDPLDGAVVGGGVVVGDEDDEGHDDEAHERRDEDPAASAHEQRHRGRRGRSPPTTVVTRSPW